MAPPARKAARELQICSCTSIRLISFIRIPIARYIPNSSSLLLIDVIQKIRKPTVRRRMEIKKVMVNSPLVICIMEESFFARISSVCRVMDEGWMPASERAESSLSRLIPSAGRIQTS